MRITTLLAATSLALSSASALAAGSVALPGSIVPLGEDVRVLGDADASGIVRFQVALKLRDAAGLAAGNAAHERLTPALLDARHFPLQASHDAVVAWLRSQGLTVERTIPSRLAIEASGSAAAVSRAFGLHLSHIVSEGQDFIAADSVPSVPASLAGTVLGINGLQPHLHAHYLHTLPAAVSPQTGGKPPFLPADLLNAYAANDLGTTGAGTTTAIIIDTFPSTSDLTKFWSLAGVSQSLSNITLIQVVKGTLPGLSGEESLDTQYSSSMGAASKVRVYASKTLSFAHIDDDFQAVLADMQSGVAITQVSISLGACEPRVPLAQAQTDDGYFATMTAMGASVFVSTGDSGAQECNRTKRTPSFFSTSPNVAAAGGTTLALNAQGQVTSETGWAGSGGGISTIFAKPAYQSNLRYAMRTVPDLGDIANPNTGVLVVIDGKSYEIGGTSVSSPVTAGLMGLVNSARIAAGKPDLGLLDTRIYPLVKTANFRDITVGNNGYPARKGYDLVTGIGAPLLSTLLPTLVGQD